MTAIAASLRAVGVLAVVGALLDPGCAQARRPTLDVAFAGDVADEVRAQELARIAAEVPWATVMDARRTSVGNGSPSTALRVVVGDAAPVLADLQARSAAIAWQATTPSLAFTSVHAPARAVSGTRADVSVNIGDVPAATRVLRVVVTDAVTGREQGHAELTRAASDTRVGVSVVVPWLATRVGEQRLRVVASAPGNDSVRPSPPGDVIVDVRPATVRVDVLEARPTWAARFARLALSAVAGVDLQTEVRVAPGIAARTSSPESGPTARHRDADVLLVGGVDALTSGDVTRLEAGVRERGQALVLLMDEAPGTGPWRRLWPDFSASIHSVPTPAIGRVGGHAWKVREWLDVPLSTRGTPLAFLESSAAPIVIGRAVGAGRVVLVTALDAWRWRADTDVAFAAGWRALVQSLGADVPPEVATTAWVSGRGRARTLQVDVAARPDLLRTGNPSVTADVGSPRQAMLMHQVEAGRWRGAVRVGAAENGPLVVQARAGTTVVRQAQASVDVTPSALVASWDDVARHQEAHGRLAAGREARSAAMRPLRESLRPSDADRWFVTRTWWFAGLALCALGAEWILRRLAGAR
ncbi:hypothetical protein LuPra_03494 [Luteitalea pratensis]|uniref:Uncharacterized protein n=1 Tax=Luteitalea pratensis TaxID=1855912 RepID=A0A143PR27_LUTPR|nr:hypothetical protein [Luteitalea pratensis]AMY10264.1 hypothetical protein LuPra_03494 [Luteitalea pratensis]